MPLLLWIDEELGLRNKVPSSLLAQSPRVHLYLWCRLQHGDLV